MSDSTPIALSQHSLILKGCVSLYDQKLRCYLGQLKIEIAKAEKMHRPGTRLNTMNGLIFI